MRDPDLSAHTQRDREGGRENDTPRYSTPHTHFLEPDLHVIRCSCVYRTFRLGNSWCCALMVTEGARYWGYYVRLGLFFFCRWRDEWRLNSSQSISFLFSDKRPAGTSWSFLDISVSELIHSLLKNV